MREFLPVNSVRRKAASYGYAFAACNTNLALLQFRTRGASAPADTGRTFADWSYAVIVRFLCKLTFTLRQGRWQRIRPQ